MNHNMYTEISGANDALKDLFSMNKRFLEGCKRNATPKDLPTELNISETTISIDCFGHMAIAKCRLVRNLKKKFAVEYVFNIAHFDSQIEVWRFYLLSDGRLSIDPSGSNYLSDYDDIKIAKILCAPVLLGVLDSLAFDITPSKVTNSTNK